MSVWERIAQLFALPIPGDVPLRPGSERLCLYGFLFANGLDPWEVEYVLRWTYKVVRREGVPEAAPEPFVWFFTQLQTPPAVKRLFSDPVKLAEFEELVLLSLRLAAGTLADGKSWAVRSKYLKLSDTEWRGYFGYNPKYRNTGTRFLTCAGRAQAGCVDNDSNASYTRGIVLRSLHDGYLYGDKSPTIVGVMSRPKSGGKNSCCTNAYKGTAYWPQRNWVPCRTDYAEHVMKWFYAKRFGKRNTELLIGYLDDKMFEHELTCGDIQAPTKSNNRYDQRQRCVAGAWFASVAAMMEAVAVYGQRLPRDLWLRAFTQAGVSIPDWNPREYPRGDPCQWLFLPELSWSKLVGLLAVLDNAVQEDRVAKGQVAVGAPPRTIDLAINEGIQGARDWLKLQAPERGRVRLPSTPVLVAAGFAVAGAAAYLWYSRER
jgi:hypothetical protein